MAASGSPRRSEKKIGWRTDSRDRSFASSGTWTAWSSASTTSRKASSSPPRIPPSRCGARPGRLDPDPHRGRWAGIPPDHLSDIFSGFHQVEKIPTGRCRGRLASRSRSRSSTPPGRHHGVEPGPTTGKGTAITISSQPGRDHKVEHAAGCSKCLSYYFSF